MVQDVVDKTVVITGASSGFGRGAALELARRGAVVVLGARREDLLADVAEECRALGGRAYAVATDVRLRDDMEKLGRAALSETGRIDVWINNAGVFPEAPVEEISAAQMQATLSINVEGVLYGAQAAAAHMEAGGAIVNMASVAAVRVRRGRAAYCSSKAAVSHLTECLAVELGDRGIRVNAIAPGFVDTEMTRWVQDDPAALAKALDNVPLHRLGSPEEIVGPMLFLLSDSARYVTGHVLAVDGGSRHV